MKPNLGRLGEGGVGGGRWVVLLLVVLGTVGFFRRITPDVLFTTSLRQGGVLLQHNFVNNFYIYTSFFSSLKLIKKILQCSNIISKMFNTLGNASIIQYPINLDTRNSNLSRKMAIKKRREIHSDILKCLALS